MDKLSSTFRGGPSTAQGWGRLEHGVCTQPCQLHLVQARLQQFNGEQLAGMMGALARLRYAPDPDWLADFERASQSRLTTEISAGGLATIVWALAEVCVFVRLTDCANQRLKKGIKGEKMRGGVRWGCSVGGWAAMHAESQGTIKGGCQSGCGREGRERADDQAGPVDHRIAKASYHCSRQAGTALHSWPRHHKLLIIVHTTGTVLLSEQMCNSTKAPMSQLPSPSEKGICKDLRDMHACRMSRTCLRAGSQGQAGSQRHALTSAHLPGPSGLKSL
eukprot:1156492-Pelagomonas_calceolata.AAC.1